MSYLLTLRQHLEAQLQEQDKWPWFEGECQQILSQAVEFENPEVWATLYGNISSAWRLNERGLQFLQRLCVWREQEARRRNKPRNWVATDSDLQSLAYTLAGTEETPSAERMNEAQGVPASLIKRNSRSLLQALNSAEATLPVERPLINAPLEPAQRKLLKKIQKLVREKADELQMAPELILKKRQIISLLGQYPNSLDWQGGLAGWRRSLLEKDIESLANSISSDGNSEAQ